MSVGWVAGGVRAHALAQRRLGLPAIHELARACDLETALGVLADSSYGHDVRPGQTLAEAQHAVVRTMVWNVRVLAGWVPQPGVQMVRSLLASVEVANILDHARALNGLDADAPIPLGRLGTAWTRVAVTGDAEELRHVLATSPWGDPGASEAGPLRVALQAMVAERVFATVPLAAGWAHDAMALLVAREQLLARRPLAGVARRCAGHVLGEAALGAHDLQELTSVLRPGSARSLDGVETPEGLWLAEARWWGLLERGAGTLSRRPATGPASLVGCIGLLAADAWRVRQALESAARGGRDAEALDEVA